MLTLFASDCSVIRRRVEGRSDRGATAAGYGLIASLVSIVIIGAVIIFGAQVDALFGLGTAAFTEAGVATGSP